VTLGWRARIWTGVGLWVAALGAALIMLLTRWDATTRTAVGGVAEFLTQPRRTVELQLPQELWLMVGDPIFARQPPDDRLVMIGVIERIGDPSSTEYQGRTRWARAALFASAPRLAAGDQLTFHQTPTSLDWVVRKMLPPHRRQEIARLISQAYVQHQAEIITLLRPLIEQSLQDAALVVRDDLNAAIQRRADQFATVGGRLRRDVLEAEIIPMINAEVWPIVVRHIEPLLNQVGVEIWARASVWRFGWRLIYDASPLPERNYTQREFGRFVQEDALPILESHVAEFMAAQQAIIEEIARSPRVREVLAENINRVLADPEVQQLAIDLFREVFFGNPRLAEAWSRAWETPEAALAMARIDELLGPTVVDIGIALFGSPDEAITPEFAQVLRWKVLQKDARWFRLEPAVDRDPSQSPPTTIEVVWGADYSANPFFFPTRKKN